ncbi:MAG: tyrosine-type recombinase/integrase [Pseudomonadales bacterium]
MPRTNNKLTTLFVRNQSRSGRYGDGNGLYLQVSLSGKSWIFRYMLKGRSREMGLGSVALVSLAQARQKAMDQRRLLLDGIDPIEHRRSKLSASHAPTFAEASNAYIEAHKAGWKNTKHADQWQATLDRYVGPHIGRIPVDQITTDHVLGVLSPIWANKTETASRVRGRVESVLSWASAHGYRKGQNPAQWRGHLDQMLPKRSKVQRVKHHPALRYSDAPAFLAMLRSRRGIVARALELTILTAARTSEVTQATWGEFQISGDRAVWTIPAERMKAQKEHRIPLVPACRNLLHNLPTIGDYVFTGTRQGPISKDAMRLLLRDMGFSQVTVHGFRSTFRDWCGEETAFPREVVEAALAHQLKDKAEAAYRRGDALERRRELMNAWCEFLMPGQVHL